jgi:dihydrofolate reductase
MAKLLYGTLASLDGYVADASGGFDWAAPDEETHAAVNDLVRSVGTFLCGRRMYEVLRYWDDPALSDDPSEVIRDFAAIWRAADKIVYSRTLDRAGPRARIEREFDADAVRRLKASNAGDISIGGPELAAVAMSAGIVDECHLFLVPAIVGAGKPALRGDVGVRLSLREARSIGDRVAYLRYDVGRG